MRPDAPAPTACKRLGCRSSCRLRHWDDGVNNEVAEANRHGWKSEVWKQVEAAAGAVKQAMTPEAPMHDLRDLLDRVAVLAGFSKGKIRARMLRVTYATARLQTLDRGAPVARSTVEKELGHGSGTMLEAVYGPLGEMRHRSDVVEYRFDQHFERRREGIFTKAGEEISAPLSRTIQVVHAVEVG